LPYKLVGAQRFYGRREVKDILCYLRLAYNPNDEASLNRVINTPTRRIGAKTQSDWRALAIRHKSTPGQLLLELAANPDNDIFNDVRTPALQAVADFAKLLARWHAAVGEQPTMELMDRILSDIDYHSYLLDAGEEEGVDRWENVLELRRLAAENRQQGLGEFLESIALVSDQDTIDESAEVPTLLTLHTAKGLEFPVVFITGLDDGTLPHSRSMDDPEEMAEERRLFYVGITRAKDRLYLVHHQFRNQYGYSEPVDPSRFLEDLPDDLVEGGNQSRSAPMARPDIWESPRTAEPVPIERKYEPGMAVRHPSWGDGMVLNSRIQDDDEVVDIFFQDVGLKKVVAAFAKLETIEKD
jgi:DNA helicase-2/ATP-dependent DNA helicase PcrA